MEFVGGGDMYDYIVERSRVTRRNGLVEEEARCEQGSSVMLKQSEAGLEERCLQWCTC